MAQNWMKLGDVRPDKMTPMLRQYAEAKAQSSDSILFFRMGDFYEMFFEDAIEAADILGLTLTSRDAANKSQRIPMAGVPYRALDGYLAKLIKAGKTVSICDQVEDPKEAKGIVKRAIVRTVTPGTVLEPQLLEDSANNYLAALVLRNGHGGIAFVDVSTGDVLTAQVEGRNGASVIDELARMDPAEVLVAPDLDEAFLSRLKELFRETAFRQRPEDDFDTSLARDRVLDLFALSTLKGIELEDAPEALSAVGAALAYAQETQRDAMPFLRLPRRYSPAGFVVLDGNTQRNLELVESLVEKSRRGTLLGVLDKTQTHMGGRLLRRWILHPLVDVPSIRARLDAVEEFVDAAELRLRLREVLKGIGDLERLLGRITSKAANAREVKSLGRSLLQVPFLLSVLSETESSLLTQLRDTTEDLADVAQVIENAIVDTPPPALTEGDLFKEGYNGELDRLRIMVRGGRDWIATLQQEESRRTGIAKLKVGYNKVFGYYIEVTKSYVHLVPQDYERKQTLVNAERYITPTLKAREEEIVSAQERMEKLEHSLFGALRDQIGGEARRIQDTASMIARVDVLLAFADVAVSKGYCKPEVDTSNDIVIRDGRHPVIENLMKQGDFVPNDALLKPADASLLIVTGPNMAGKSTYLRQVALIALMAQMGTYVPAASARIGAVDRIFTRVGASDNLARGESTFMVEMIETAGILNTATQRSLLVLDEIGRGTSTFDGISIAWSVAEHIHNTIGAKTLFATHYHELTELATQLPNAKNLSVAVREWGGKVIFLYRIVEGGADHSYGIQVAKLAGLPKVVIERARHILEALESGNAATLGLSGQMHLFAPQTPPEPSPVEAELGAVDLEGMAPREAQDFLFHLRDLVDRSQNKER